MKKELVIWHFNQKQISRLKHGRKQDENIEECEKHMGHDQKICQRRHVSPRRENRTEAESEGRMATNFPELTKGIKQQIQKTLQALSRMYERKAYLTKHIWVKSKTAQSQWQRNNFINSQWREKKITFKETTRAEFLTEKKMEGRTQCNGIFIRLM